MMGYLWREKRLAFKDRSFVSTRVKPEFQKQLKIFQILVYI